VEYEWLLVRINGKYYNITILHGDTYRWDTYKDTYKLCNVPVHGQPKKFAKAGLQTTHLWGSGQNGNC